MTIFTCWLWWLQTCQGPLKGVTERYKTHQEISGLMHTGFVILQHFQLISTISSLGFLFALCQLISSCQSISSVQF